MTRSTRATKAGKTTGAWDTSKFRFTDLRKLEREGFVAGADVRVPGNEAVPRPRSDERVCFAAYMQRGLSLPMHAFLRGLLHAYGLQLHDLTPNSLLQIACFVTLCECFLGVFPHWGLWKHLFDVKRSCKSYQTGGVQVSVKSNVTYFNLEQRESVQGWRSKWFYIKDQPVVGQQFGLTPFDPSAQVKRTRAWRHELTDAERAVVAPLYLRVEELKKTAGREVSGLHLMALFSKRCVQPLQQRSSPMWRFSGVDDPTRVLREDSSSVKFESRVHRLTRFSKEDWNRELLACPVRPFSLDSPPAEVSGNSESCLISVDMFPRCS